MQKKKVNISLKEGYDVELINKQFNEAINLVTATSSAKNISSEVEHLLFPIEKESHALQEQFNFISELSKSQGFADELLRASQAYEVLYKNPTQSELDSYISAAHIALGIYPSHIDNIKEVAEKVNSPWLNTFNSSQSLLGLNGLSAIGKTLNNELHPFSLANTNSLRHELGDWRNTTQSFDNLDHAKRIEFYTLNGLNPSISSFPTNTFNEVLDITSIQNPIMHEVPTEQETIDSCKQYENEAFTTLRSLEVAIRDFIDTKMNKKHGSDWLKELGFNDLKESWTDKKEKQRDIEEQNYSLIYFADFTDYERIIIQKNTWKSIFEPVFRNKDSLRESFRRLYPIRIATMHSRTICSDDILYLRSEATRLLKAIRKFQH